jgi:hypothetical protein
MVWAAVITSLASLVTALALLLSVALNGRRIKEVSGKVQTPSGQSIGEVAEEIKTVVKNGNGQSFL